MLAQLPKGTEKPIVDRFETDAMPILTIAISGRRDLREITELARKQIKEQLETVSGVGAATIVGGRTPRDERHGRYRQAGCLQAVDRRRAVGT